MGASRVAGSVYFSFSSCPVRPGSICQASSGWGRRGGGAEELFLGVHARVGGARAPAWAGRGAGGGTVVQLRRLVRGAPWRREGDGVGARGSPSGCGQGRGQRRGATRQPVQYCGALTMARGPRAADGIQCRRIGQFAHWLPDDFQHEKKRKFRAVLASSRSSRTLIPS